MKVRKKSGKLGLLGRLVEMDTECLNPRGAFYVVGEE